MSSIREFTQRFLMMLLVLALVTGCQGASANPNPTATSEDMAASDAAVTEENSEPAAEAMTSEELQNLAFSDAIQATAQAAKPPVVQIVSRVETDMFEEPLTVPAGVGSGVIYDEEGHILTNNHVIAHAEELTVSLPDGRTFTAEVVGRDPRSDIAVLQIDGDDLPVADLGNSDGLRVGDWVIAIGNALGLPGGPTVTAGVVSTLDRTLRQPPNAPEGGQGYFLFDLIQTDAPINPGNSGGPLINLAGEVVGINALGAGMTDAGVQAQGIGFAISIVTAHSIAEKLVAQGEVVYPYMGIRYLTLNPAVAAQLGIERTRGIIIGEVVDGSPADEAGLQQEDIVTAVDGTKLEGQSDLARIINERVPGDTLTLTVLREGEEMQLELTLGEAPNP
jgi:serine protease Do